MLHKLETIRRPITKILRSKDLLKYPLLIPEQFDEELRFIRHKIFAEMKRESQLAIGLVSSAPGEGNTTVALQLALSMASLRKKTLLVDASDNAGLTQLLNLKNHPGLQDFHYNHVSLQEAIHPIPTVETLSCLPYGTLKMQDISDFRWGDALSGIRNQYEIAFVDLPPISTSTLAFSISSLLDGIILVIAAHQTRRESAKIAKAELEKYGGKKILGIILNKRQFFIPNFLYRHL